VSARPRAVVCLSGGMDSCVCAAMAAQANDVYALHFSYGQRTEARELASARAVADRLHCKQFLPLHMDLFRQIGGSALVDENIDVPVVTASGAKAHLLGADDTARLKPCPSESTFTEMSVRSGDAIPVTYVPFRNAHFLSAAVSWAEVLGAATVYIGAVEQDSSGYPDCRPAYYQAFQEVVNRGTKAGGIELMTPLIALRKSEIVRRGIALGAPLDLTWSCYTGEAEACGVCESCALRLQAFAQAGVRDPVPYAAHY
jgi:7-cyano-7-deazaguanine synthase